MAGTCFKPGNPGPVVGVTFLFTDNYIKDERSSKESTTS
jgi:hypothetical protein